MLFTISFAKTAKHAARRIQMRAPELFLKASYLATIIISIIWPMLNYNAKATPGFDDDAPVDKLIERGRRVRCMSTA